MRKFTARILNVTWMNNSASGNPRCRLTFDNGEVFPTQPDAACAYGIENPEMRGLVDVTVQRGQVTHCTPTSNQPVHSVNKEGSQ